MNHLAATKIDTKMLHRATVAIVFAILYLLLGFVVSSRHRVERSGAGAFLVATGIEGTDSFKYEVEPLAEPFVGILGTDELSRYPFVVRGWLRFLHPGIPLHHTQLSVTWCPEGCMAVPLTSKQLLNKHVPLKSLPASARDPIHGSEHDDTILQMLKNRQLTKWSIAWSDVAFLVAQAVCGAVCITAVVQWYRLLKTLGYVEAGGCITCGYPIAPNTGTCPECGHVHGA